MNSDDADVSVAEDSNPEAQSVSHRLGRAVLKVRHHRRTAQLLWYRRPVATGFAWLKYDDNGEELEVPLAEVKLVALL
jgi:ParB family chromosome partitioning protein